MKHTPAPWKLENHGIYGGEITSEKGLSIAITGNVFGDVETDKANARLIAAAPELLEALQGLFEQCAMIHKYGGSADNTKESNAAIDAAHEAIRKATQS